MASKYENKSNEELRKIFEEVCVEINSRKAKEKAEEEEKEAREMKEEYEASKAKAIKSFRHKIIGDYGLSEESVNNASDEIIVFVRDLITTIDDCKDAYRRLGDEKGELLSFRYKVLNRLPERILRKYKLH